MPQTEKGDTLHTYIILYCIAPPQGLFCHTWMLKYQVTEKKGKRENNTSVVKTQYDDSSFNKFKNERAQYVEVLESEIQR